MKFSIIFGGRNAAKTRPGRNGEICLCNAAAGWLRQAFRTDQKGREHCMQAVKC